MERENDFTQGSIAGKLLKFMIPVFGSLVLQAMYGAVDLLVVGRFGTTEGLSGVSTGSQVMNFVTFVITGLAMGLTVIIAGYLGEKKNDRIGKAIGSSVMLFIVISCVLFLVMVPFSHQIAVLMQAPESAVEETASYVRICGVGIFFIVAYNVIAAIFRGLGDSKTPLIFVGVACIVNIFGDLFCVAVLHMNAAGAAVATVAAQAVSVILSLIVMKKRDLPFQMSLKDIRFNEELPRFIKVGTPLALQEMLTQFSFIAICAFVNALGLEASSGYGVGCKIVNFVMLVPSALMQSLASFISQNVGAGEEERARKTMFTGMGIGVTAGVTMFVIIWFFGRNLCGIFTTDSTVIEKGYAYLLGFAPEAVVTGINFSMIGYFNGHERAFWVMMQGLLQTVIVRLPMAYYMSIQPNASLTLIGLASPCATAFGIVINVIYYLYMSRKLHQQENMRLSTNAA